MAVDAGSTGMARRQAEVKGETTVCVLNQDRTIGQCRMNWVTNRLACPGSHPAVTDLAITMLDRQKQLYGRYPFKAGFTCFRSA